MNLNTQRLKLWSKLFCLLVIPALTLGLSLVYLSQAATPGDFDYLNNISRTAKLPRESGPPQMDSAGSTIAIVWADGANADLDTKGNGNIFLKSADEIDNYWRAKIKVFAATTNNWGADPSFIFEQTSPYTIHVVWAQANSCGGIIRNCQFEAIQYTRCDVSGDYNTCLPAQTVSSNGTTDPNELVSYRNPDIVQDDQGNLHVVWSDDKPGGDEELYYSRGVVNGETVTWSGAAEVTAAPNGKKPQLAFSNGRLHMAWQNKNEEAIYYLYDDTYTDDTLVAAGSRNWDFLDQPQGNPTLTAMDRWLFLAFDMEEAENPDQFALVYVRSQNNGVGWELVKYVPEQDDETYYQSSARTVDIFGGLKPHLVVTSTTPVTWGSMRLSVVWHSLVSKGEEKTYQAYYSSRVVSEVTYISQDWDHNPPLNVTDPPPPERRSPGKVLGVGSRDSTEPALTITDPAEGGTGKLHLAFLDKEQASDSWWDVYYRGFIAGTKDPDYIRDEVKLAKAVSPTLIITAGASVSSEELAYTIQFTNGGNLNAIGVGFTDTLPAEIANVANINIIPDTLPAPVYNSTNNVVTWFGDLDAESTISISFTAVTAEGVAVNTIMTNTVGLWNETSLRSTVESEKILLSAQASTYIQPALEYILANLFLDKVVTPTLIITTTDPVPAQDLAYAITIQNTGVVNVDGLSITDTMSSEINSASVSNLQASGGNPPQINGNFITWSGTVPAESKLTISFEAETTNNLPLPSTVVNTVELWYAPISSGPVLGPKNALTQIRQWEIYLPVVLKN